MTEDETVQQGCDLIATQIHGWKKCHRDTALYKETLLNGYIQGHFIDEFKPYQNAEQSDAVLDQILMLRWNKCHIEYNSRTKYWSVNLSRYNCHAWDSCYGLDQDRRFAIFKACVKASKWIRDNQEKE